MEQTHEQELEKKLRESLDKSSNYNRNLLTIYLGLLAYIIITAATTTDMMLLIGSSTIKLPILSSEIPLLLFFKFTPFVIIIFHLYLLINLSLHDDNYIRWLDMGNNKPSLLAPFVFNYFRKHGQSTIMKTAIILIIVILYYFLPLFTLIWTAYKFLPYHDNTITLPHNFVITFDGFMSIYFYWRISKNFHVLMLKYFFIIAAFISLFILCSWSIVLIPNNNRGLDRVFHRNLVITRKTIVSKEVSDVIIAHYLQDNKTKEDALRGQAEILDLHGRDLSYSNFSSSKFINVDLTNAILQDANLSQAIFQGVDLSHANLQGAFIAMATLQEAYLFMANLQDAELAGAILQGADLSHVNLQGADLGAAQYLMDDLFYKKGYVNVRKPQGADSAGTALFVGGANLQGASLWGANLQGTNLTKARLQGADLSGANFQGAYLAAARFQCSSIDAYDLKGIYYDDINDLFDIPPAYLEINKYTSEQCKSFDNKSKALLIHKLESNKNLKLFLDINKKLACENATLAKNISNRSNILGPIEVTFDNGTKASFKEIIREHMKEHCPKYLSP